MVLLPDPPEARKPEAQHTARRSPVAASLAAGLLALACAGTPRPFPEPEPPPAWNAELEAEAEDLARWLAGHPIAGDDAIVVRLAFGGRTDLDLYVTGPAKETIYFGNATARTGGALERDERCAGDPAAVRAEIIRFDAPQPGSYRIGVDHPGGCDGSTEAVPFAITIDAAGARRTLRGLAPPRVFTPIVDAFELGERAEAAAGPPG